MALALACTTEVGVIGVGSSIASTDGFGSNTGCDETNKFPCKSLCADLPDGDYCGFNAAYADTAVEPNDLVRCEAGLAISLSPCPFGCQEPQTGTASCVSDIGTCGDGVVDPDEECDGGPCCSDCSFAPATEICEEVASSGYGCPWGIDPSEDVGVRTRPRHCSGANEDCDGSLGTWGIWTTFELCASYEACSPNSITCVCVVTDAWEPSVSADGSESARLYNQDGLYTLPIPIRLELAEMTFAELKVRACMDQDPPIDLLTTLHVRIVGTRGEIFFDDPLPPNGSPCTDWGDLGGESVYLEDETLDANWRIVQPAEVAQQWTVSCTANSGDSAPGSCWWDEGLTPPLIRTCALP